jgi:hypothetical protein
MFSWLFKMAKTYNPKTVWKPIPPILPLKRTYSEMDLQKYENMTTGQIVWQKPPALWDDPPAVEPPSSPDLMIDEDATTEDVEAMESDPPPPPYPRPPRPPTRAAPPSPTQASASASDSSPPPYEYTDADTDTEEEEEEKDEDKEIDLHWEPPTKRKKENDIDYGYTGLGRRGWQRIRKAGRIANKYIHQKKADEIKNMYEDIVSHATNSLQLQPGSVYGEFKEQLRFEVFTVLSDCFEELY